MFSLLDYDKKYTHICIKEIKEDITTEIFKKTPAKT